MRWLVIIIIACLLLTVLKAAIAVLLILLGIAVLCCLYSRPAELFGFFLLMSFMGVLERYPLPVLLLIGVLGGSNLPLIFVGIAFVIGGGLLQLRIARRA